MCSRGTFSPLEPYLRGGGEARKKLARRDRRSRWRRREGERREGRKEGRKVDVGGSLACSTRFDRFPWPGAGAGRKEGEKKRKRKEERGSVRGVG